MKKDLRQIVDREIQRINAVSKTKPLERDDIEKLKSLATAIKTLEDSKAPETDDITDLLRVTSIEDLNDILDKTEGE